MFFWREGSLGDRNLADPAGGLGGLCEVAKELVAPVSGRIDTLGAKRAADALLRERRWINRVMQKPRSVVIPEVVVRVRVADAQGREGDEVGWHDA